MNGTFSTLWVEQSDRDREVLISQVLQTLKNNGGTWAPFGSPQHFESGYIVGGIVPTVKVPATLFGTVLEDAFSAFQHRFPHNAGGNRYFGTWVHDGVIHLDVVERIDDLVEAITVARERGELAIWDCRYNGDIPVGRQRQ